MESDEKKEINDWRNEHGEPDHSYLESLKEDGSIEALGKLRAVASDIDVNFHSTTAAEELVGLIMLAVEKNEEGNPRNTN